MKLILTIDIITILYKPTGEEVFKCAEVSNGNETEMQDLKYKYPPFAVTEEHRKIANENGCMYDNYMNAEGFDELHRFLSYVEDCDFFDIRYSTQTVEV